MMVASKIHRSCIYNVNFYLYLYIIFAGVRILIFVPGEPPLLLSFGNKKPTTPYTSEIVGFFYIFLLCREPSPHALSFRAAEYCPSGSIFDLYITENIILDPVYHRNAIDK